MKGTLYLGVVVLVNGDVVSDLFVVCLIIVVASNVVAGDIEIEVVGSVIFVLCNIIKIIRCERNSLPRSCCTC